jgi:heme/copper-type cytochrome/quinol oxidase subunit 3
MSSSSTPSGPGPLDDRAAREPSFGNAGTVGMILFLAALSMLFFAGLLGFVWMRFRGTNAPPAGSIHLPALLLLSTAMVIGVSVALTLATRQIRAGMHRSYRKSLTAALALAAGFLTVQTPALANLLLSHRALREQKVHIYGLVFFLILLHALHVVGGMVTLTMVTVRAHRGAYERIGAGHDPIRMTAMYWHFLDAVWIVMFSVLYLLR